MTRRITQRPSMGFTLVELMVAMVLGLIVVGGALSVIASNKRSYRTNEALSQVQESARTAFELLARDIRQAGATGCDNTGRVASTLNSSTDWWSTGLGVRGYDSSQTHPNVTQGGTAVGNRIDGTDSVQIRGTFGTGLYVETHDPTAANLKINATTADIVERDILMVCDFDHATIFQVTNYNSSNVTLVHNASNGQTIQPGNCTKGMGYPTICTQNGNAYTFRPNSQIVKFGASDWYIGNNGRAAEGGRSLFRKRLLSGAERVAFGSETRVEEVVAGVSDLQLSYRVDGTNSFVAADHGSMTATNWPLVNAVKIELTMMSADSRVSTSTANTGRLQRTFTHIVTLRNRVP